MKKYAELFLLSSLLFLTGCVSMHEVKQKSIKENKRVSVTPKQKKVEAAQKQTEIRDNQGKIVEPSDKQVNKEEAGKPKKPKEPEELKKARYFTLKNKKVQYQIKDYILLDVGPNELVWVIMADFTNLSEDVQKPNQLYKAATVSQTRKVLKPAKLPENYQVEGVDEAIQQAAKEVLPGETVKVGIAYRIENYMPINLSFDQDIFPNQKDVELTIN